MSRHEANAQFALKHAIEFVSEAIQQLFFVDTAGLYSLRPELGNIRAELEATYAKLQERIDEV